MAVREWHGYRDISIDDTIVVYLLTSVKRISVVTDLVFFIFRPGVIFRHTLLPPIIRAVQPTFSGHKKTRKWVDDGVYEVAGRRTRLSAIGHDGFARGVFVTCRSPRSVFVLTTRINIVV